jgi:hypothetical protein
MSSSMNDVSSTIGSMVAGSGDGQTTGGGNYLMGGVPGAGFFVRGWLVTTKKFKFTPR